MSIFSDLSRGQSRNIARLDQSRELVLSALTHAFSKALSSFDDMCLARGTWADVSQVELHAVSHQLHRQQERVIGHYRHYLQRAWQASDFGKVMTADVAFGEAFDGASCASSEGNQQTRQLARDLVNALTRDCSPLLARLDRRLGLINMYASDLAHRPIGPAHVFAAVHQALSICGFSSDAHWKMSTLIMYEMKPHLMEAYQALERALGPQITTTEKIKYRSMTWCRYAGDIPAWTAPLAQVPERKGVVESGSDTAEQALLLEALSRLGRQLRVVCKTGSKQVLGTSDMESRIQADAPSLSKQQILAALSMLQATSNTEELRSSGEGKSTLAQSLKTKVINQLVQQGMASKNACFLTMDEDAIDLMCLLFQTLLEQYNHEAKVRGLIARLVVPFVKVALLDRRVFVQAMHPARDLLNTLIEACESDADVSGRRSTIKAEEIVERLLAHFKQNLMIFSALKDELLDFLSQHRRQIEMAERRAAELQRGHERLEAARAVVAAELATRLEGRLVPQAIEDFLRQPWAHHLTMALLREGEIGPMVTSALALADGVLHELSQAQRQIVNLAWLQEWRHALIKVFSSVGMGGDAAGTAIDALRTTLEAVSMSRPELERALPDLPPVAEPASRAAEAQLLGLEVVRGSSALDFDSRDAEYFRALPIGVWMDFVEKTGEIRAGKLSWVSPVSSRLLFVDRRGERCCVASPEELAVMVRLGRLRPHAHEGAFDRAMRFAIERLNEACHIMH